jgi:hypothetical protein
MRRTEIEERILGRNELLSNVIGIACFGFAISCQGTNLKFVNSFLSLVFIFALMYRLDYGDPFIALRKKEGKTKRDVSTLKAHDQLIRKNLPRGVPFIVGFLFLFFQVIISFFTSVKHDFNLIASTASDIILTIKDF